MYENPSQLMIVNKVTLGSFLMNTESLFVQLISGPHFGYSIWACTGLNAALGLIGTK